MDRRTFLAATAALPLAAAVRADDDTILDAHVHVWDRARFTLPWLKADSPLAADLGVAEYRAATAGTPTREAIYAEVDVAPAQKQAEADFIRAACASGNSPFVAAVVGGNVLDVGFLNYAEQFRGDRYVKGVREVLHVPERGPRHCLKPEYVAAVRGLGKLGLTFDLCVRAADLSNVAEFAAACADTRLILDHCGNPNLQGDLSAWKRDLERVAKRENVAVKLSGILVTARKGWTPADVAPVIRHTYDTFGPDRVLFASDWPVCTLGGTYAHWLGGVRATLPALDAGSRRKLYRENARRWYGVG